MPFAPATFPVPETVIEAAAAETVLPNVSRFEDESVIALETLSVPLVVTVPVPETANVGVVTVLEGVNVPPDTESEVVAAVVPLLVTVPPVMDIVAVVILADDVNVVPVAIVSELQVIVPEGVKVAAPLKVAELNVVPAVMLTGVAAVLAKVAV